MTERTNNIVEKGLDGWLFLIGGSNPFLPFLNGEESLAPETVQAWSHLLRGRQQAFAEKGIKYIHIFAPEKLSIYPEKFRENLTSDKCHSQVLSEKLGSLFLNLVPFLQRTKTKVDCYNKTDSHWNFYGCFAAYQKLMFALSLPADNSLLNIPRKEKDVVWDLGAHFDPPIREKSRIPSLPRHAIRIHANAPVLYKEHTRRYNEPGLHVGSAAVFRNTHATVAQRVMLFGDSFSEYRPHMLTGLLAETFAEVHFVWSCGSIDFAYIDAFKPDIVISETAERFVTTLPTNDFSVQAARSRLQFFVDAKSEQERHEVWLQGERKPDYIIAGSMKCGTTILNDFICEHPMVSPAKQKEIHYFTLHKSKGADWYAAFFSGKRGDERMGDASPTYFDMTVDETLPRQIDTALPRSKVILALRHPVDRAISHFYHLRDVNKLPALQGKEVDDFFTGNLRGKYEHEFTAAHELQFLGHVLSFGLFSEKMRLFRSVFGSRLLVVRNEELWYEPNETMRRVYGHLELPAFNVSSFGRRNYVTRHLHEPGTDCLSALDEFYADDLRAVEEALDAQLRSEIFADSSN